MKIIDLEKLFLARDYEKIAEIIVEHPEQLPYPFQEFSKRKIRALTNYALAEYTTFVWKLLEVLNGEEAREVINSLVNRYYSLVSSINGVDAIFVKHFKVFLVEAIAINRTDVTLLKKVAKIASNNNDRESISKIEEYVIANPGISYEDLLYFAKLPYFSLHKTKSFANRILKYGDEAYYNYISSLVTKDAKMDAIHSIADSVTFPRMIYNFNWNEADFDAIMDYTINYDATSDRLWHLNEVALALLTNPEIVNIDRIKCLVKSNDLNLIRYFMGLLSVEKQEELIFEVLQEGNINTIKVLAITTSCDETYNLINYLISQNDFSIDVFLIDSVFNTRLDGASYWRFAVLAIISQRSEDYIIALLNQLFILNSDKFIEFMEFLRSDISHKFNDDMQNQIDDYYEYLLTSQMEDEKEDASLNLKK